MRNLRLTTLLMLGAATVCITLAYAQKKQDDAVYKPKTFHMVFAVWDVGEDGAKKLHGIRVGDVEVDGSAKMWAAGWAKEPGEYDPALKVSQANVPAPKNGVAGGYHSVAWFRSRPDFLREEMILGYRCFTLGDGKMEATYCPEFGANPLRIATKRTVIEAIKVY